MTMEDIDRIYALKNRIEKLNDIANKLDGDLEDEVRESVLGKHIVKSVQACIDMELDGCDLCDLAALLKQWIGRTSSLALSELMRLTGMEKEEKEEKEEK